MASGMEMVSFEKIYRQKDEKFISVLNKVREGQMDDDVFDTINSRCIQSDNNQGYVEIVTTNSKATAINEMRISSLPGSLRKLEAVINGDYHKDAPVEKNSFLERRIKSYDNKKRRRVLQWLSWYCIIYKKGGD